MAPLSEAARTEVRAKILAFIESEGGSYRNGAHTTAKLMEVGGLGKAAGAAFMERMQRDGLVEIERPGRIVMGVSVKENGVKENGVAASVQESSNGSAPTPPSNDLLGTPLSNLFLRIQAREQQAEETLAEMARVREVIEFLENPPPQFDASGPIRAERDHLQRVVNQLRTDRERMVEQRDLARTAQARAENHAAEVEALNVGLTKNLHTMLNRRSRSGITIRELLSDEVRESIDRLMKETPTTKG